MARVLLNGLASTAGGGVTYLRNVLPRLGPLASRHVFSVFVPPAQVSEYAQLTNAANVTITTAAPRGGLLGRWWWEQTSLRQFMRRQQLEVLVALGNFAMWRAPVPQVLFNRNDLYFSAAFSRDMRERGEWSMLAGHWLKTQMARLSIRHATVNVTPTRAFAERISAQMGMNVDEFAVLPFGIDARQFNEQRVPLASATLSKLNHAPTSYRLLYVSHYNYFRNFETLLRALPLLKAQLAAQSETIQLVLTTDLQAGANYGGYDVTRAAALIDELGLRADIAMLGAVPYAQLPALYQHCDLFVCPSYAESFGHPVLEAMAAGVPVVAADLPVQREIGGSAARYFSVFNAAHLATECLAVLRSQTMQAEMRAAGLANCERFTWDAHVSKLAALLDELG